jgi:hypothetical protein
MGVLHAELSVCAGPFLTPLFLVGLFLAAPRRRHVLLHGALALALILQYVVLCAYQPLPRLLYPYAPMVLALATYWLLTLLGEWTAALPAVRRKYKGMGLSLDVVVLTLVAVLVSLPLLIFLFAGSTNTASTYLTTTLPNLRAVPYDYIATNDPWMVAWKSEKKALLLPMGDRDWGAMADEGLTPTAIYFSPYLVEEPAGEYMQFWQRMLLMRKMDYRGMTLVPSWNKGGWLLAQPMGAGAAAGVAPVAPAPAPLAPAPLTPAPAHKPGAAPAAPAARP